MEECMEDCCEVRLALCLRNVLLTPAVQLCPEPKNAEEHDILDKEDKSYVRGRIAYVVP